MAGEFGSTCYSMREPFKRAVGSVRSALVSRGLRVVGQLDVSKRVQTSLGIGLPPCRLILVMPNLITTAGLHPGATDLLPLHIVVSGRGLQTEIHVQNAVRASDDTVGPDLGNPVVETQMKVSRALESIAMRMSLI